MFRWFFGKKEVEKLRNETKNSFEAVKKDISKTGSWITHLNENDIKLKTELDFVKEELSSIKDELEQLKDFVSIFGNRVSRQVSKKSRQLSSDWTGVGAVQTAVQRGVQDPNFDDFFKFSVVERAIIWVLLNSDLRLSYEDISAILGKERSTVRSHINSIKQKSKGLIADVVERNGKKRVFIPEPLKNRLLKSAKVRLKLSGKRDKKKKNKENVFEIVRYRGKEKRKSRKS